MKTIVVTGAGGYIGVAGGARLAGRGVQVIAVDRSAGVGADETPGVRWVAADLFDPALVLCELMGACPTCACTWHGATGSPTTMKAIWTTFLPTTLPHEHGPSGGGADRRHGHHARGGVLGGAITADAPCNPQASTASPRTPCARDLRSRWRRCRSPSSGCALSTSTATTRRPSPFSVKFCAPRRRGRTLTPFTTGKNLYDFITVKELARQIAAVVLQDEVTGVINCCTGAPESLADRVEGLIRENGLSIALDYGAFPDRPYDSPGVWGDATEIRAIIMASEGSSGAEGGRKSAEVS